MCVYIEDKSTNVSIFLSLWVFLPQFAHTPGAAQYFVSTVAPVCSGTARIIITAPQPKPVSFAKSTNAGSSLHTGNERMIAERSHFTEKKKKI